MGGVADGGDSSGGSAAGGKGGDISGDGGVAGGGARVRSTGPAGGGSSGRGETGDNGGHDGNGGDAHIKRESKSRSHRMGTFTVLLGRQAEKTLYAARLRCTKSSQPLPLSSRFWRSNHKQFRGASVEIRCSAVIRMRLVHSDRSGIG